MCFVVYFCPNICNCVKLLYCLTNKKKEKMNENEKRAAGIHALKCIEACLPQGVTATNKLAVMKQKDHDSPTYTSWAKDAEGKKFLAVLKGDNKVKLVPEVEATEYHNVH